MCVCVLFGCARVRCRGQVQVQVQVLVQVQRGSTEAAAEVWRCRRRCTDAVWASYRRNGEERRELLGRNEPIGQKGHFHTSQTQHFEPGALSSHLLFFAHRTHSCQFEASSNFSCHLVTSWRLTISTRNVLFGPALPPSVSLSWHYRLFQSSSSVVIFSV